MSRLLRWPVWAPVYRWSLIGLVLVVLGWTLALGWLLPLWLKPTLERALTQALHTPVQIARLSLSPWSLTLDLEGLSIGPTTQPFLRLHHGQAQLAVQSIWRRAPIIRRLTLTQPQLFIERQTAQRFNISPILEQLRGGAGGTDGSAEPASAHFAIHNIRIQAGQIDYVDRALSPAQPQQHHIHSIEVGIPFLSNLPSDSAVEVRPFLAAQINGSPLRLSGKSLPFSTTQATALDVHWQAVDLAFWAPLLKPLLPPAWQADIKQGWLDAQLQISFAHVAEPAVPQLQISGALQVKQLAGNLPQQHVALQWQQLQVQQLVTRPLEQRLQIQQVLLDGLAVQAGPFSPTTANTAAAPATRPQPAQAAPVAPAPAVPWQWAVGRLRIQAARAALSPMAGQAWPQIEDLQLDWQHLDGRRDAPPSQLSLHWRDATQAHMQVAGTIQLAQQQAELDVALQDLQPHLWLAPWQALWPVQLTQGRLDLQLHVQANPAQLRLKDVELQVADLQAAQPNTVRPGPKPAASQLPATNGAPADSAGQLALAELQLHHGQAQLDFQQDAQDVPTHLSQLRLGQIHARQLQVEVWRDAQGHWLGRRSDPAGTTAQRTTANVVTPSPEIQVDELRCQTCQLVVTDHSTQPTNRYSLTQSEWLLRGLSGDLSRTTEFDIRGQAQGTGSLALKGSASLQPLVLDSLVQLKNVDLQAIQPFIAPYLQLNLIAARAQADGRIRLQMKPQAPLQARYQGRLGLTDVRSADRLNQAEFLRWKTLSLQGMDVHWQDAVLNADLGRILLEDFYGRLILNANGALNISQIIRAQGDEPQSITSPNVPASPAAASQPTTPPELAVAEPPAEAASAASAPAVAAVRPKPATTHQIKWQSIQLKAGQVDFSDNFVQPAYSVRLTHLNGLVSAAASGRSELAEVDVLGKIDDAAPLRIKGRVHSLGPQRGADIEVAARGIELSRFSPYAARYAGYAIDKGTLSMNVHYRVQAGHLTADNQLFLDQLTFGQRVESPEATKLPVLLLVSLLKNSRGEIDINLPISGSLDDPQFSVGRILLKVLGNLLSKAAASPFQLLASLVGGQDDLAFIHFAPGQSQLTAATQQQLDNLIKLLKDRPALKVDITGLADTRADVAGLGQAYLYQLMQQAKAQATHTEAESVTISPEERMQWLSAAYKQAKIKKPRNVVGLAKTLTPSEMEALLIAAAPTDEVALIALAHQRADAAKAYLAEHIDAARILLTPAQTVSNTEKPKGQPDAAGIRLTMR